MNEVSDKFSNTYLLIYSLLLVKIYSFYQIYIKPYNLAGFVNFNQLKIVLELCVKNCISSPYLLRNPIVISVL